MSKGHKERKRERERENPRRGRERERERGRGGREREREVGLTRSWAHAHPKWGLSSPIAGLKFRNRETIT